LDGTGDPFDAPVIATPTPALRGWLQIQLAEKLGIAANLNFPHLEKLLWDRLAELDHFREAEDRQPARQLDAINLQGMILARLEVTPPEAVRQYLYPANAEPHDQARRQCQLAGRLAALFREYEYSRVSEGGFKGLAESWMRGEACFEQYLRKSKLSESQKKQVLDLEKWQREIYQALFQKNGLRDQWGEATGIYRYTLPQYAEMVLGQERSTNPKPKPQKTFHLFGLSHISPFHRALIYKLGHSDTFGNSAVDFEIYALNPCSEYWEDVSPPRKPLTHAQLQAEELPEESQDNALLSRFGKPGRETIRLWSQITDYDFKACFQEPQSGSLLATVQRAVLHRGGPLEESERPNQDASLQVASAPDRHAEVEAARAQIAELLLANPRLHPEEIAIIPVNLEDYLPVIESVFTGAPHGAGVVPYCLSEAGMLQESSLLRGFLDLLDIGSGAFQRSDFISWLENPTVQTRLRLNGSAIANFGDLLEAAGFHEGWDAKSHAGQDAFPDSLSNMEAALRRTLLGYILDPNDAELENAGLHPLSNTGRDRDELSSCLEILDTLRRDLQPFASGQALSFREWSRHLSHLLEAWFAPNSNHALDIQAMADLRRFCADVGLWNRSLTESPDSQRVTHHTIVMLLEDHFRNPRSARMPFLRGGVRVGSLSALRGLPFRHVWVLGLNAGDFPSPAGSAPLDLRSYRRVIGEADPASRDLYAFLEVICTTSETLHLSYTRHDAKKDSVRQPSHALAGLIAHLESDILPISNNETPVNFSIIELDSDGRYANDENTGKKWPAPPRPQMETLRRKTLENLSETEALAILNAKLSLPASPTWAVIPEENTPTFAIRDLAEYLQNPVGHACFRHFRFSGEVEEEEEIRELFLNQWQNELYLDAALQAELVQPGQGKKAALLALQRNIWNGQGPPGIYATLELENLAKETQKFLDGSVQELKNALQHLGLHYAGALRLGGPGSLRMQSPLCDAPAFNAAKIGANTTIEGSFPHFFMGENSEQGWALLLDKKSSHREKLAVYVFHLCTAALDAGGRFSGPGYALSKDGAIFRLAPDLTPANAATHLANLLQDALRTPDFDHLPLSIIEKIARPSEEEASNLEYWKERIDDEERDENDSFFKPSGQRARILRALEPETPQDAGDKIARRILPYLDWLKDWKAVEP